MARWLKDFFVGGRGGDGRQGGFNEKCASKHTSKFVAEVMKYNTSNRGWSPSPRLTDR